jgi:hypothetical protein
MVMVVVLFLRRIGLNVWLPFRNFLTIEDGTCKPRGAEKPATSGPSLQLPPSGVIVPEMSASLPATVLLPRE